MPDSTRDLCAQKPKRETSVDWAIEVPFIKVSITTAARFPCEALPQIVRTLCSEHRGLLVKQTGSIALAEERFYMQDSNLLNRQTMI